MPRAYEVECDGTLLAARGLCTGIIHRYRRQALSFGTPFMTSATLCRQHLGALPFWQEAAREGGEPGVHGARAEAAGRGAAVSVGRSTVPTRSMHTHRRGSN